MRSRVAAVGITVVAVGSGVAFVAAGGVTTASAGAAATGAAGAGAAAFGPIPSETLTQLGGFVIGAGANLESCIP